MNLHPPASRPVAAARVPLTVLAAAVGLLTSVTVGPASATGSDEPTDTELAEVNEAVEESGVDGIAWHTDGVNDEVVVTADSTVSLAEQNRIRWAAREDLDALKIERVSGAFEPLRAMYPGDAVYGRGVRCTMGFNVRKGGKYYFLTAGHCGKLVPVWHARSSQGKVIGRTVISPYPNKDYALVRYDSRWRDRPGGYRWAKPRVGEAVTRDGSTTGTHSGRITALGVTVRYVGGTTVRGLVQADICAEPGDSGGPLYRGSKAFGLTSGGAGACPARGITFYQPVGKILRAHGLSLY
ncbi:S1 family peptidase [Promicromonospora sp. NPDC019610]|uniref:S1 family peptidase n=1 Tax=Promicromonospora sp. NPDC019610 TaxID=3364405 RepID=UPI0037AF0C5C